MSWEQFNVEDEDDGQQQLNDNEEQSWEEEKRKYNLKLLNDLLKELQMDITKWKSVAITVEDYAVLKSLCTKEFRAPAAFVSMLLKQYVQKQARGEKIKPETFVKKLL